MAEAPSVRQLDAGWPVPYEEVRGDRAGLAARLEFLALRGVVGGAARLPRGLREALTAGLARLAATLERRHSDGARRFLEQAHGGQLDRDRREALVRAAWRHLIWSLLDDEIFDRRVLRAPDPLAHYDLSELGELPRVLAAGSGALMVTCHLGAWEALAALGPLLGMHPFYAISRPPRNRPLSAHFQARREARGYRVLARHGAIASIPRIVAAGGYVALLLDQRARGKTVLAPFFGRPAHCERSIAVLARRLKVPVVVVAGIKLPRAERVAVRVPRVFWPAELAGLGPEEFLTAINVEFERMILSAPEQYLWLHDRYRKAPPPPPA